MGSRTRFASAIGAAAMISALMTGSVVAADNTVAVTDANAAGHGWLAVSGPAAGCGAAGTQAMENGPGTPPLGAGSREFRMDTVLMSYEAFRLSAYNGTLLADLTELEYSTYIDSHPGNTGQAPYITLSIDTDGNGAADEGLNYEPIYNGGATIGSWQTWNARDGLWWPSASAFSLFTLDAFIAANPNAVITSGTGGAMRIAAGCGWAPGFVGNADAFTVGVGVNSTTYNFELVAPPPVPASKDACKKNGWQTLGRADGSAFKNQGDCVSYVNTGK